MSEVKNYTKDIEELFIKFFLTDAELFVRCMGITDPKHFKDPTHRNCITFIKNHAEEHASLPTLEQIFAMTGKQYERIVDALDNHKDWFLKEFEQFCIHRELENIIYSGPDLLEDGRYGEILAKVKDALAIGLVKDLGTDYYKDPIERLEAVRDGGGNISTGLITLDDKLFGGLNRGELSIFCGQSGAGKSIFLQNIAINWAEMGLNVVYLSLELSEQLCSMRMDAMTTGIHTTDIMKNIEDVALRVRSSYMKHKGTLRIKQLKNGCTANDIKAYIKEYEIQTGIKVDAIALDYLDLCMPYSVKVSPSDMFVKDKYVSEELRNLAVELNVLMLTASQLNRSSYDTLEYGHDSISGGISKIMSADNVFGIFTTTTMRENGRYQIQLMKTRSSSGVGSKIDLGFNNKTLRIYDLKSDDDNAVTVQAGVILDGLTKSGVVQPPKATASVRGLKDLMRDLGNS